MEVKPATQLDLDWVLQNPVKGATDKYRDFKIQGWAKTGLVKGHIVAVGGVVEFWKGVGEAWIYMSTNSNDYPVETVRTIARMIELAFEELKLVRLEAKAREDFPAAQKMLETLGFEIEGLKMKYNPDGTNSYAYSIVR